MIVAIERSDDTNLFSEVYSKIKNNELTFDFKNIFNSCINIFTKEVKNILSLLKYMLIVVFLNGFGYFF